MAHWRDQLRGGNADRLTPAMFPKRLLIDGMHHELEHTKSRRLAMEIAMDHLAEDLDYYRKLKTIEGNPSTSRRQQRFMCAEYGRKQRGQRTKTGMSARQLKEFCMARKKNPKEKWKDWNNDRYPSRPRFSLADAAKLWLKKQKAKKKKKQTTRAKNPHLMSGKWRFVGMFAKGDISGVKRILRIHGIKAKVTKDALKGEKGQRELYVERGAFDTAYRAISRLFEAGKAA